MRTIILLLVAAFCCAGAGAQVPRQVNYQGYLTDAGGTPVNATLPMAFKLYDVASGGAALYGETQTVTVTAGVFNALIGTVTPLTLPFDQPYWLGLTVGAEVVEMVPRQPLAASPYALRAVSAEVLAATATVPGSQVSGALAGATLPAGNLTGTIAPGALPASQQLPAIPCAPAQIPKWNGSAWACAADDSGGLAGGAVGQVLTGTGGAPAWTGSPALGGSLTLANPSTATTGSIMKGGNRFLHNFGPGNTFVGENAGNFALSGGNNTGAGGNALLSNTSGAWNTAHGFQALALNQDGGGNTAIGMQALFYNVSGGGNTAVGLNALLDATGSNNIGVGSGAGNALTSGNDNVAIVNPGVAGESGTIRLGGASQTRTFIAGVRGVTTGNADGLPVVIDSAGQLGTAPTAAVPGTQLVDASVTAAKLASSGCIGGQILKYNGAAWACATDGIGDLGCQESQIIIWNATAKVWQCTDIGGFSWDIFYAGGTVDFVPEQYGTMVLPAGTTLFFDPIASTFSGDVSACGVGGFFLYIDAGDIGHVADLQYSNGASGPFPAGWSVRTIGGGQDGVLQQATALSWRAGCYTNVVGPVPPFSAKIVFNKAFPTGKKYE